MNGFQIMALLCLLTIALTSTALAAPDFLPPSGSAWSGSGATVIENLCRGVIVRFEKQQTADALSTIGANFAPVDLSKAEILEIGFSVNRPAKGIRIVLADKDGVGADMVLTDLLKVPSLEPGKGYNAFWAYRYNPGWVRYGRTRMRWEAITSISFYVGPSDLDTPLELKAGNPRLYTCDKLAGSGLPVPPRVLPNDDSAYQLQRYFVTRATELTNKTHKRNSPARFKADEDKPRDAFRNALLMPPDEGPAKAISLGFVEIDGVKIEKRLVNTRPGVYVTCNVYFPPNTKGKSPGVLLLPGHGNMDWESGIQEIGLAFAKQGCVTYFVEPFGQGQRGYNPMRNELLGNMSTGILIAAGQSLIGMIVDERRKVLDDMASRPEIDPEKLAVTGVSMGGTHSLWLAAADPRVKVAVANAAVEFWRPEFSYCHISLADVIVNQFKIADDETVSALVAPRTLVRMYPTANALVSLKLADDFREGWYDYTSLRAEPNWLTEQQVLDEYFGYTRSIFREHGVEQELAVEIIPGPHAYPKDMREVAMGWFNHVFDGAKIGLTPQEPPVDPIPNKPPEKMAETKAKLYCWPDGKRPDDYLTPGQYALKVISEKVKKLPAAPSSAAQWREMRGRILKGVRRSVSTKYQDYSTRAKEISVIDLKDHRLTKLVVQPEKGIDVPVLVVAPRPVVSGFVTVVSGFERSGNPETTGRLLIYLSPDGLARTASSPRAEALLKRGWNVAYADLRGLGETRMASESGGYIGFRDWDLCNSSLRIGETMAGLWARDLSAVIDALRKRPEFANCRISIWAEKETGFPAALVAASGPKIDSIVLEGMLASYLSPRGYGGLYIYKNENHQNVNPQPTLCYGSGVPWIPNILDHADIPQLLALCAPKRLLMLAPMGINGKSNDGQTNYDWTYTAYSCSKSSGFSMADSLPDEVAIDWLDGSAH